MIYISDGKKIKVTKNGPYTVFGGIPLKEEAIKKDAMGRSERWEETGKHYPDDIYCLCRCGNSSNKPFCTGDHIGFDGGETASRSTYDENAKVYPGTEGVELLQDPALCVGAAFCHGRYDIGRTVKKKNTMDIALQQTYDCPGGSLVIKINGVKQEQELGKSISASTTYRNAGPLLVKGGIPVESSDGYVYEVRNRVALCRCGKSRNKPFCDGAHLR
ncbi:MAG: CDGSH iron-sulfur domain-containing protein [Candidatus Methanoplasma sp.]|nr:CDGSH iron-sulfur domain-containing protein [Candidatus Methanoplasma sp.]